jgi:signal peptidase I
LIKNKLDLSLKLIEEKGKIYLRLSGFSMFPFLKEGDVALIKKVEITALKIGDVIVFKQGEKMIAHRLFEIVKNGEHFTITTKGDTSQNNDPIFTEKEYVGKIISYNRKEKKITITTKFYELIGRIIVKTSQLNTPFFVLNKRICRKIWINRKDYNL